MYFQIKLHKFKGLYGFNKILGITIEYKSHEKIIKCVHEIKGISKSNQIKTTLQIEPGDYIIEVACAFTDTLKYIQIKTKNGQRITVGAARENENKL